MSRTRFIYFLSAIVLIIGCFALNTSYSLFVDNDSTQLVETTVPTITDEVTLSLSSVEVEGTKEYLIKQTIINNNSIPIGFRLTASSDSTTYQVQSTKYQDDTYLSYGTVEANTSKDIYLRVANTNEDISNIATINFTLESDYATLKMNTDEYLANANIDNDSAYEITFTDGGAPYSNNIDFLTYKLIEKQINNFGSEVETVETTNLSDYSLDDVFGSSSKMKLPLQIANGVLSVPELTQITDVEKSNVGLYKAEDDYGTSYYYRGANTTNYVDFAGFTWRIVRINGDGSVRLILNDMLDTVTKDEVAVYTNPKLSAIDSDGKVVYNENRTDNAYVGYMYGNFTGASTSYNQAHNNEVDSVIKTYIDAYYEEYLIDYEEYLADTLFCADKTLKSIQSSDSNGFGEVSTSYAPFERWNQNTQPAYPTLECAKGASDTFSRYSRDGGKTSKGVLLNDSLDYPIALLTSDEIMLAGGYGQVKNSDYYLSDAFSKSKGWWTMTPQTHYTVFISYAYSTSFGGSPVNTAFYIRPVINLKGNLLWESGDGSKELPYTVKLS